MGEWTTLYTSCGAVQGWLESPQGEARGALVVVQEIFGANAHIRGVCQRLAQDGFIALAPSYFDLITAPGTELAYDAPGTHRGKALVDQLGLDCAVDVTEEAANALADMDHKVGVVGFCWGGTVALLACTRLSLPAVSYYGARNLPFLDEPAGAPLMFHFGGRDASIPPEAIAAHREKQPQAQTFVYKAADHAFNREVGHAYDPEAAALAWQRSLGFFREHLT